MLQAAVYAMWAADQTCQVPASADSTFQAGVYNGFTGKDLRAQWEACFAPDQALADDVYAMGKAIESKDWGNVKKIILAHKDSAIQDAKKCTDDAQYIEVNKAYQAQEALAKKMLADPDWQIHLLMKDVRPHFAEIKGYE